MRATTAAAQARAARIAGALYLVTIATAMFAQVFVQASLTVRGDAVRTAQNILAHDRLFRIGIASDLFAFAGIVPLTVALYVLLRPVNEDLATLASLWRVAEASILCVAALGSLTAQALLSGHDYLKTFDPARLHFLALLALVMRGAGYNIGLALLGLGSGVFNSLLFRSRYVPRALAAWGIFSSLLVLTSAFWAIVSPASARTPLLASYAALFVYEVTLGFWLLLKGARIWHARPARPEGSGPWTEATK